MQDALLPLHSLYFNQEEGTFSALCNRFCWEHDGHFFKGEPLYHRVHSGLCFRHVRAVHHKGFHRSVERHPLNLLSLQAEEKPGYVNVHLLFSGQSEIRLQAEAIKCHLGDLHYPWPTRHKPNHDL